MDDLLALCRRVYPAARLYKGWDGPILEVDGVITSTQMQGQYCAFTVRNNIGDTPIVVNKGACPDYCWKYLEPTKPYCSVEIAGVMTASDSAPGGIETKITHWRNPHIFYHNIRRLTTGWLRVGKQLPKLDEAILKYVQKYPKIKQADIIRKIGHENSTTIRKHLHELVQSKKIKRESNGYTLIDYDFGNKVTELYCEDGSMSDAFEHIIPCDQPDHHKSETTNPLEILCLCIDRNIEYYKRLQIMLPEYNFYSKDTILRHISDYPEHLDEFIEDEINHWSSLQYSVRDKCADMCEGILYQLHNSDNREDIEGMLYYTVERILEHTLSADKKAQKLKYDSHAKNKQKNKIKNLERKREAGFKDLCSIHDNLECRLVLSEFEKNLEELQKKYQKPYSSPDSNRSKKTLKPRDAKLYPNLESEITELIIQDPGIRQNAIMEKFKYPKSTIERRLENLQVQREIMRLPGYKARYAAARCRYTQDLERLLIFHTERIVCYLEEVKMKIRDCPDEAKLSILEHMASKHYKKIEEEVETRTTKLKRAFREIDDYANETNHLLENSKRVVKKQEWASIIDKIRLKQRKYKHDAMKFEEAVYDRRNIEKAEQMWLQFQVNDLAYSDAEMDMRVIRLALKYEFDLAVLEQTWDEMQNRYMVRNTTEIEDVINTMLDVEPQIFSVHQDLLETIMEIKFRMDASRTYRPCTIIESDGQPEFVLPNIDSCIQARKMYSEYSSMWNTIKNWHDIRTYDDVIAPLVGKAANLHSHYDIDFNMYEE